MNVLNCIERILNKIGFYIKMYFLSPSTLNKL